MNAIRIISASAGSGKTWQLAQELFEAITHENDATRARPEAIVAVTFTIKAAGELQQRARSRLLEHDRKVEAQRLAAARIGTVNAVCGRLVNDFAFELGHSPKLEVLDEIGSAELLASALSRVIAEHGEIDLDTLSSRLTGWGYFGLTWDWQADVRRVVELARANRIDADDLPECARRSLEGVRRLYPDPAASDGAALDRELALTLDDFLEDTTDNGDTTKGTIAARGEARRMLAGLRERTAPWHRWAKLAKIKVGKKSRDAIGPVHVAAGRHDHHPLLRSDLEQAVAVVFDLAQRVLHRYQQRKRAHGLIDFVDQEALALDLLGDPAVRERLRDEIDLVLVDEFQDTSPIQLAIFLRLSEVAGRSIWVGDQKQSIYAFRGTDPSLMDAVIERVLEDGDAETALKTLDKSWRSRPELVKVTSDIFTQAFEKHGIPEDRVRLVAASELGPEPDGLGAIAECWSLLGPEGERKKKEHDHAALATVVRDLLADENVLVRDEIDGTARRLRPDDVAILCRTNRVCVTVAGDLESLDVRAALAPADVAETIEARTILAGVRLWIDRDDALAAAELARILDDPDDGSRWLEAIAKRGAGKAFDDLDFVRLIREARDARPLLGAVEVVDEITNLLDATDLCRRWGDAAVRLANVERLRAHAVEYARRCRSEGIGCTPAGLLADLRAAAERHAHDAEPAATPGSVQILTWHGAKGLEWPITVLYELEERDHVLDAMGVHVETDRVRIELDDPLAERWIRYWPWPYGAQKTEIPLLERLAKTDENRNAADLADREELRLLYVGWTRARDRVVLAAPAGRLTKGTLERLDLTKIIDVAPIRPGGPSEPVPLRVEPDPTYEPREPRDHPPAVVTPSSIESTATPDEIGAPVRLGDRIDVDGAVNPDWQHLGDAVHGFLAADRPGELDDDTRRAIALRLLDAWCVANVIAVDDLLEASTRLDNWINATWPGAKRRRELPMAARDPATGTITRGIADLILETTGGELVVIDHKSFPGTESQATAKAAGFAGQLGAYATMTAAAFDAPVVASLIHMPLVGMVVPVSRQEESAPG